MNLWISVKDRLPEPGVRVLVHSGTGYFNEAHSIFIAKLPTYPVRADWYPNGCWLQDGGDVPARAEVPAEMIDHWTELPCRPVILRAPGDPKATGGG